MAEAQQRSVWESGEAYEPYVGRWSRLVAREFPHSTRFSGSVCPRSSKASRGEDLEVEEPVCGRYSPAFHFYPTLPGMLSPTLIGHQVIQMCQPRKEYLLAAA
jgi:hypothetical protein